MYRALLSDMLDVREGKCHGEDYVTGCGLSI